MLCPRNLAKSRDVYAGLMAELRADAMPIAEFVRCVVAAQQFLGKSAVLHSHVNAARLTEALGHRRWRNQLSSVS